MSNCVNDVKNDQFEGSWRERFDSFDRLTSKNVAKNQFYCRDVWKKF